jgi:hypothetical protein
MAGNWRSRTLGLGGWLIPPTLAWGALTGAAGLIWAALAGLPAVVVALIALAALTLGVMLAHYAPSLRKYLPNHEPPPELKREVTAIQRELIRLRNRREINGGSMWPVHRPYQDLPANEWNAYGEKLRLSREDREAVARAYELAGDFNDKMLVGETTIGSSPAVEPDLDGLRNAFDRAAAALGLPPAPATAAPPASDHPRRDDRGELAQKCHMLAGSIERWVESYKRQQPATVEKMVEEWLAADSTVDEAEARRKAYDRYDKNWRTGYAIKYRPEAKKLFDDAWEMHEIAKSLERLAVQPVPTEFEEVPKLFNDIAARLYGDESG